MLIEHVLVYWMGAFALMIYQDQYILPNYECVKNVLWNQLIVNPLLFICIFDFDHVTDGGGALRIIFSFPFVYLIEELGFYWMHRLFHANRWLWNYHKVHHRWFDTYPYSALDCHPIEHVWVNMLPLVLGPWLFSWTYTPTFLWFMLATLNTLKAHSFAAPNVRAHHALHHRHKNINYGLSMFTDFLFGTTIRNNDEFD